MTIIKWEKTKENQDQRCEQSIKAKMKFTQFIQENKVIGSKGELSSEGVILENAPKVEKLIGKYCM